MPSSPAAPHPRTPVQGFTLIEVMIVVAILAILAAVAFPSYQQYLRKSRRADALQALTAIQQAQERWRGVKTTYAGNTDLRNPWPSGLGFDVPTQSGDTAPAKSKDRYYTLAIASDPAPTGFSYQVTATAVAGTSQAKDNPSAALDCTVLTMAAANGTATYTPAECFSK